MSIAKTCRIAAAGFGRVALPAGLTCLLAAGTCAAGQKTIEDSGPEKTIPRLEFRVLDVGPDHKPVKSFSYRCEILSVAEKEPLSKDKTAYRSDDGILRISRPYPPYGRIRLWIDAVDSDHAATGYRSFSYRIDEQRKVAPPDIALELQILITGAVLDAETGKPVAGAEVAPVQYAHPFSSFPDWEEAVKSDSAGKYRLVTSEAIGIAARCHGYDEKQEGGGHAFQESQYWSFVPGHNLRQHEPEAGPDGFVLRLVPQPMKPETPNESYPDRKPQPPIRGQVLDQNSQPVQDCRVELQKNPDEDWRSFEEIPGPDRQGKWMLSEYDGEAKDFLLRVLVDGKVRSQKRFTLKDIADAAIIMRLTPGWKVTGRLHAPVPFDRDNTPVVTLVGNNATDDCTPAHVQADGRFCFTGVPDGKYVLAVRHPALWRQYREQIVREHNAAMSVMGGDSHAPFTIPVTVSGADAQLDPIDLGRAGVLAGWLTGVVYQGDGMTPFSNGFGYVSSKTIDTGFGFYYYLRFMTDAEGRIDVPNFPPGTFRVRFANDTMADATRWNWEYIRVLPGKTHRVRLFAEDPDDAVTIRLNVGDGLTPDVLAGAALDPDAMRRYPQQKEESYPKDIDGGRYRAIPARVACNLVPLEDSIDHWSGLGHGFEFGPNNLMKGHRPQVVIDDVLPGRWRLTVSAYTYQDYDCEETVLVREVAVTNRMPPLEITLPSAALAGRLQQQAKSAKPGELHSVLDESEKVAIEAIPQQASLPTRSCQAKYAFRFLGLEPGRYTLRFRAKDFHEKRIADVIVEKGKTTWLAPVPLERTAEPASSDKPRP